RTDVRFAADAGGLEVVEAESRDHAREEGARVLDVGDGEESRDGVLDEVFGVAHRAHHAIGEAAQRWACGLGLLGAKVRPWFGGRHECSDGVVSGCGRRVSGRRGCSARKGMARRFQRLIIPIARVRFAICSGVKCSCRARYDASLGPFGPKVVTASVHARAARSAGVNTLVSSQAAVRVMRSIASPERSASPVCMWIQYPQPLSWDARNFTRVMRSCPTELLASACSTRSRWGRVSPRMPA